MWDFIAKYGILSGIGAAALTGIVTLVRLVGSRKHVPYRVTFGGVAKRTADGQVILLPPPRYTVQLFPLHFELLLNQPVPEAVIHLLVINFTERELTDCQVTIHDFHPSQGINLRDITATEYPTPPHNCREAVIRRRLNPYEVQPFDKLPDHARQNGVVSCSVTGKSGRKEVSFRASSYAIDGWVFR